MPQPRQLSAYDPEWEEDPHFAASSRKAASTASQSKKLPSPAVLRDILAELTDKQRSEECEMMQASAPGSGPIGETTHLRYLGTSTSMTFEGEMDAIAAVVSNDVGRTTHRKGELTAAMAGIAPEPDLVRVNAGTGSKLQLDSVWISGDALKPVGGDQALYAAPLLATMGAAFHLSPHLFCARFGYLFAHPLHSFFAQGATSQRRTRRRWRSAGS